MKENWLVVLPYVPYPMNRGSYQRVFHLTQALGESTDLDLFCLAESGEGLDQGSAFSAFTRRHHFEEFHHPKWPKLVPDRLLQPLPSTVRHWQCPSVARSLSKFIEGQSYTGVVFCDIVLWPYIESILPHQRVRVMDRSRVDWLFQTEELNTLKLTLKERFLRRENLFKISRLEKKAYGALAGEIVCGPDDKTFLASKLPDTDKIHVLANGYNDKYFNAGNWPRAITEKPSVLFCGALDYTPNIDCLEWYLAEIHDAVLAALPDYTFFIVGRNPGSDLTSLANRPGVQLVGGVPDVRPWYQKSWIQAVPLRIGGGTRLKIPESLAMCTPVVSTSLGAQGLDLKNGRDIILADTAESLASEVIKLLVDTDSRKRLERDGLAAVQAKYTWSRLGQQYVEILEDIKNAQS